MGTTCSRPAVLDDYQVTLFLEAVHQHGISYCASSEQAPLDPCQLTGCFTVVVAHVAEAEGT